MIFPWLEEAEIEAKAEDLLRRTFGVSLDRSRPVDLEEVVLHLSETEQLSYDDEAVLRSEDGEIVLGKTQPLRRRILLSRELKRDADPGRARFTLAHELGHWILHRPLFVMKGEELSLFAPEDQNEFEFVGLKRAIFPEEGGRRVPPEEWQANRFAVALLIDSAVLRDEFRQRFGDSSVARRSTGWRLRSSTLREHSRLLAGCYVDAHVPLREVFGLSTEAMAIALESRGYAVEELPLL